LIHELPAPLASKSKPFIVQLLWLAVPIAIGIMVQTSYHVINAFWVGRVGADAIAVVTLSFPVMLILIAIASGLSLAGSILIAQRHGASNYSEINHLAGQTLTGLTILATILTLLGLLLAPFIVTQLGATSDLLQPATNYFRTTLLGTVFVYLNLAYQAILRGKGAVKAPLVIIVPSVVCNAMLDPLLIFGWGPVPALGVQGAAYATVLTQFISAIAGIWLLLLPRFGFNLHIRQIKFDWQRQKQLLRLGLPASIEQSMGAMTVSVVTSLASHYGIIPLASYGIVFRILSFCLIPGVGVSMAISILIGRRLGAGDTQKACNMAKQTLVVNVLLLLSIALVVFLSAQFIVALFIHANLELQRYATVLLQIVAFSLPFTAIQMALNGAFRGAGDTLAAMAISLTSVWLYQIPLSLLLPAITPLKDLGLWWATTIAAILIGITAIVYYKSGRWLRKFK